MGKVSLPGTVGAAKRGCQYVKNYGVPKLYRKVRERLDRNHLERDYQEWMTLSRPARSEKALQREHSFEYQPLISVIVPVYRTPEGFLREMIESVLNQTYQNLELCLADGSGIVDGPEKVIREYMEKDERVRYQKLASNLGIAGNTNAAAEMASGEYLAMLDHDDLLEEHALFEIVRWLQEAPQTDFLYTDEDKVAFDSKTYFQPHFKPDFNLDLLRSNNYICHFLVVKKELAFQAGLYREEYDGAQDYDFILRCSELAQQIGHLPKVLYHWRCHKASTASNPESKTYAYEAGRRAVEAHLERCRIAARVESMDNPGFYRVIYLPQGKPKVSIILLDVNETDVLRRFDKVIRQSTDYPNLELFLLWDGQEKNKFILNFVKEHRQNPIKVVYCSSACNKFVTFSKLAEKLDSDYFLFLDSRIESISRDWLDIFLGNAQREDAGVVGGRVYDSDRRLKAGAKVLGLGGTVGDAFGGLRAGYSGYIHKAVLQQNFHAVSGKALMVKKDNFVRVGGFSEDVEDRFKDVDLCLKVEQLGLRNIYDPGIVLKEHKYRKHRKKTSRVTGAFAAKWRQLLEQPDGYYNCNLSLQENDYRIQKRH